jgi:hypothetical protein
MGERTSICSASAYSFAHERASRMVKSPPPLTRYALTDLTWVSASALVMCLAVSVPRCAGVLHRKMGSSGLASSATPAARHSPSRSRCHRESSRPCHPRDSRMSRRTRNGIHRNRRQEDDLSMYLRPYNNPSHSRRFNASIQTAFSVRHWRLSYRTAVTKARIEDNAQTVAKEVHAENRDEDRHTGEKRNP